MDTHHEIQIFAGIASMIAQANNVCQPDCRGIVDSVDLRIETNQRLWYAKGGTTNITVGGCLRLCRGQPMISWMELLTYTLVIIGIINLCIQINNKK